MSAAWLAFQAEARSVGSSVQRRSELQPSRGSETAKKRLVRACEALQAPFAADGRLREAASDLPQLVFTLAQALRERPSEPQTMCSARRAAMRATAAPEFGVGACG